MRFDVHEVEVVDSRCGRVMVVGVDPVAGGREEEVRLAILVGGGRVGDGRLHRLGQADKVELVRVSLAMHLQIQIGDIR